MLSFFLNLHRIAIELNFGDKYIQEAYQTMKSIKLSRFFGLPKWLPPCQKWRVAGNKLVSEHALTATEWTTIQSSGLINGFWIQANGMSFHARLPQIPNDTDLCQYLDGYGSWVYQDGPALLKRLDSEIYIEPYQTRIQEQHFTHLVLESEPPDLSTLKDGRKADLLLPSGVVTVFVDAVTDYDLICWNTQKLAEAPDQYRKLVGNNIYVDRSAVLNACLYGTG